MSKIGQYLQEHVIGEVISTVDARRYFSTDGSVFSVVPTLIVYPRGENDVRKTARFTWQLAERGRIIPITARGAGTDQGGAAIGSGIIMAFPAHMHRIIELDGKSGIVTVEPGINYGKLQQTLQTHGRFLPPFPSSFEYSTIGGAVANNAAGEKSVKYGDTRSYVQQLRVVLANGEVIETGRINKRELNKKLGLATFEGEVYRSIDALIEESGSVIEGMYRNVSKNAAGYAIIDVKHPDGSIDLTPLFVGSQGTLGIVTQVTLETESYNPETSLILATFDDLNSLQAAVLELRALSEMPSALEMVDGNLLSIADATNPAMLKGIFEKPFPNFVALIEYDNSGDRAQHKAVNKAQKVLAKYAQLVQVETELAKQEKLWKLRHASAAVITHNDGNIKALPIIEDGIVPLERFHEYLTGIYEIFARNQLKVAIWGHAGDANLHMQPFLDLSQVGDRQRAFRVIEEYYSLVISLGGSTSGEHGDGRLRGPYLEALYGKDGYAVLKKVKQIFDPYGTLNPGVKIDVTIDDLKPILRREYSLSHLYDHLPRS